MHLVTGRAGTPHINSNMVGFFNAGLVGSDSYILDTQNKLALTVEDANSITIATGDALVQGRHVTNEAPVTLTIESGGQGVSRHDLVVVRYTNSAGIESAELAVITGTPSATPADPPYEDGSILDGDSLVEIPLYRIVIEGLAVSSTNQLVPTIPPIQKMTVRQFLDVIYQHAGEKTVSANGLLDYSFTVQEVDGKTPRGIVSCYMSKPGTCSVVDCYLNGNVAHVWVLNRTNAPVPLTCSLGVLYLAL